MQVLTPSGYVDIIDLNIGDEVVAYDINTGAQIINHLEGKTLFTPDMYPPDIIEGYYDENGDWVPPVVVRTSYEVFQSIHGDWKFYRINNTWSLFKDQSVWANLNVIHAFDLQIGDIVYNDQDVDVVITSIEEVDIPLSWWRLDVSGDSSYIADDISLHNASRFWVGGGSSSNWNATANTNWSATSGGVNNASVPTSADSATFNGLGGAGNTSSIISATVTILSLTITAAYTATMTHNAVLTVAGSITLGANYTIAGASAITISATSTFTSSGKTWPNNIIHTNTQTCTLVGNLTVSGLVTITGATTTNRTATETLNYNGGIAVNNTLAGTAVIILAGGTWSGTNTTGIANSLTINGNITISGNVYYRTGTLSHTSGTPVVTGSTLNLTANATLNTSTMSWNNVSISAGTIYTLTSSLNINGLLSAAVGGGTAVNRTTSEVINCFGGFNIGNNFTGTATIVAKGGTLISNGFAAINGPSLTIDGNVTFSGNFTYGGGTMTYLSGNVITQNSLLATGNSTLNTKGITWNNVQLNDTVTLTSDFTAIGSFTQINLTTINKTNNEEFNVYGNVTISNLQLRGTANFVILGGTWSATSVTVNYISSPVVIAGDVRLGTNCSVGGGTGSITYRSGRILSGTLNVIDNQLFTNMHQCPIPKVIVTTGRTITMNQFFTGTPSNPAAISASTAVGQYTVTFTDSFERISTNVVVSGCVLSRPMQLILSSLFRINSIKTTNSGIRYVNQSPNGFAKDNPVVSNLSTGPAGGLVGDPCFTKQL